MKDKNAELILNAEADLEEVFKRINSVEYAVQERVIEAFRRHRVAARHFNPTTGYGYDDEGRDTLDKLFADALCCEKALAAPQFSSGTHTLFTALSALLMPGDTLYCAAGRPYDTLVEAIGIEGCVPGSLAAYGVKYIQSELDRDGKLDLDAIASVLKSKPRLVYFQRSRGYAWRESLKPEDMRPAFELIKELSPQSIIMVDNCYGEFTCVNEPSSFGADIIAGSLIKNPGGGLAHTGGYIAGRGDLIDIIAGRVMVPGIGREAGCWPAGYLPYYQGLFIAPHVVAGALKTSALFARVFEIKGMETMPSAYAVRSDIVQALRFENKEQLLEFCRIIQSVSPVDSFVVPEPWAMPGYTDEVIMAAGAFVQGASIELSADAPIREPYTGYIQGALTYGHGRYAVKKVLDAFDRI